MYVYLQTNKQTKHVFNRKYFNSNAKKSILSIKLMSRQTFSDEIHLKHSAKLEATKKKLLRRTLRKKKNVKKVMKFEITGIPDIVQFLLNCVITFLNRTCITFFPFIHLLIHSFIRPIHSQKQYVFSSLETPQ